MLTDRNQHDSEAPILRKCDSETCKEHGYVHDRDRHFSVTTSTADQLSGLLDSARQSSLADTLLQQMRVVFDARRHFSSSYGIEISEVLA